METINLCEGHISNIHVVFCNGDVSVNVIHNGDFYPNVLIQRETFNHILQGKGVSGNIKVSSVEGINSFFEISHS